MRKVSVGLGGLGVTCSPRDPSFTGSNPAEVDGLLQDSGRDFKLGVFYHDIINRKEVKTVFKIFGK